MSKLIPLVAGATGTLTIVATGGYLLSTQTTKTIKDSFKHALIDLNGKEEDLLKEKLNKLKLVDSIPENGKLKEAKKKKAETADSGLAELKEGCKEIYNSNFTDKDSKIFKDFQAYCARTNKDKLGKDGWAVEGTNSKNRQAKLKDSLTPELAKIKSKEAGGENSLKEWCNKVADLVFEGDTDLTYTNAKEYCKKED